MKIHKRKLLPVIMMVIHKKQVKVILIQKKLHQVIPVIMFLPVIMITDQKVKQVKVIILQMI